MEYFKFERRGEREVQSDVILNTISGILNRIEG